MQHRMVGSHDSAIGPPASVGGRDDERERIVGVPQGTRGIEMTAQWQWTSSGPHYGRRTSLLSRKSGTTTAASGRLSRPPPVLHKRELPYRSPAAAWTAQAF